MIFRESTEWVWYFHISVMLVTEAGRLELHVQGEVCIKVGEGFKRCVLSDTSQKVSVRFTWCGKTLSLSHSS